MSIASIVAWLSLAEGYTSAELDLHTKLYLHGIVTGGLLVGCIWVLVATRKFWRESGQ